MSKFILQKNKANLELFLVLFLLAGGILFTLYKNITLSREFHLSLQASSFLQGRVDIQEEPERSVDTITGKDGRFYFWHEPLASVLMIPWVYIMGNRAPQGYLTFIITIVNIFLVWKLTGKRENKLSITMRLWLILIFFFASNMVSVIFSPNSWYLVQNLAITFVLLGILEWKGKRRAGVLFLVMLFLVLTRRNTGMMLGVYLLIDALMEMEKWRKNFWPILLVIIAGVIASVFLIWYFGIGSRNGGWENFSSMPPQSVNTDQAQTEKIKQKGFFAIRNIPSNFVKYFMLGPEIVKAIPDAHANLIYPYMYPKQDGMSFFLLSPVFFSLLILPFPKKKVWLPVLGAILVWAGIYLTFFASGAAQFGSRYSAEMIPFLFLILMVVFPAYLGKRVKILITGSVFLNILFFVLLNAYGALMR